MAEEQNFFQKMKTRMEDVQLDGEGSVPTAKFIEASKELVAIFDILGGVAFGPVKSDMNGNIVKIETRFKSNPEKNATLQKIVQSEKAEGLNTATEGMMWFKRGLEMLDIAFERSLKDPKEEICDSFTAAYEVTLRPNHGMLIRPIFSMAMKATPYRKDFYAKLGKDQEQLLKDMVSYMGSFSKVVKSLAKIYVDAGLEKPTKR